MAIILPSIYPGKMKTCDHTKACSWFIAVSFIYSQSPKVKTIQMSFNSEWISKLWYSHTIEYYAAINRNELLTHATTWLNLKGVVLSERSQSQEATYYMILSI